MGYLREQRGVAVSVFSDKLVLEMDRIGLKERKQRAAALGVTYPMMQFIEEGTRLPADGTIMKLAGLVSDQTIRELRVMAQAERAGPDARVLWDSIAEKMAGNGNGHADLPISREAPVWTNIRSGSREVTERAGEMVGSIMISEGEYKSGVVLVRCGDESCSPEIRQGEIGCFAPIGNIALAEGDVVLVELPGENYWTMRRIAGGLSGTVRFTGDGVESVTASQEQAKSMVKGVLLRVTRVVKKTVLFP